MSRWIKRQIFFGPALVRLFIFSLVTVGNTLLVQLEGKKTQDFADFHWAEWCVFVVPIVIAWLGVWLAFIDQTLARLKESKEGEPI